MGKLPDSDKPTRAKLVAFGGEDPFDREVENEIIQGTQLQELMTHTKGGEEDRPNPAVLSGWQLLLEYKVIDPSVRHSVTGEPTSKPRMFCLPRMEPWKLTSKPWSKCNTSTFNNMTNMAWDLD